MTDTGQIPGEGLPENAGMVEQPGVPAPDAYTYLEPSAHTVEDDDLLLMPAPQGAWSDAPAAPTGRTEQFPAYDQAAHGTHGSGVTDVNGVRIPAHTPVQVPAAAAPARRPLHRGPSATEAPSYGGPPTGGVVRSLADRGPAGPQNPMPVRHAGPPTTGPEYFDIPADDAAVLPGPQLGEIPPQGGSAWGSPEQAAAPAPVAEPEAPVAPAEHVVPVAPAEPVAPVESVAPAEPVVPEVPGTPAETVAPEPAAADVVPEAPVEPAVETVEAPPAAALAEAPAAVPAETPVAAPAEAPVEVPAEALAPVETPGPSLPADGFAPTAPDLAPTMLPDPVAPAVEPAPVVEAAAVEPEPVAEAAPVVEPAAVEAPPVVEPAPEPPVLVAEPAPAAVEVPEATEPVAVEQPETPAEPEVHAETLPEALVEPEPAPEAVAPPQAAPRALAEPEPEPEPGTGPEIIETPEAEVLAEEAPETALPVEGAAAPAEAEAQAEAHAEAGTEAETGTEAAAAVEEAPFSPPAPGYGDAEREAVLRVMRERRDIRNGFRSDPIPHEVLLRVLEAAHTAPSVGHSQPWDFVVIRSAETRRSMHELAQRQREAYAKSLPKARAKQFKELKIEAILDTPVNIVVTADPTRGGRHTLGRHTQPQMAPYSSALAVENLWLAARAEGLGVGWVSFFDEREMVRALGLPEHLEVVAYLCVGYVDEFPEEPELMQAGWAKRRPLSWVVHEETYGRRALPGEEPHDLLQETIAGIRPLDAKALGEAWERQKRMTKPAGALGMLEIISAQLSGLSRLCPPPVPEPAAVAIFAGDHGVHAQGVTAWPQEVTGQMVANFLGGGAVCNAFAAQVGAEVCVVDVGVAAELPATPGLLPRKVRPGTADFTTGPALTRDEVLAAIEVGIETARDLVAAGNKGLLTGEMGIANTTASAALICVYTGMDPAEVTGRGTGINDEMHARKVDVVRRGLELHQPDPADPIGVLAAVGGLEHAAMAGFLLGGASLRTPVILDGVSAGAAALVARAIAPEALAACIAGHRSAEPGHVAALNKLGLRPLVDLDLRLGEGTGALLALPIVQSAARAMHDVATFDSAGVTEK
ncbi:nicotinate-nucleotide--dimethylbenzimidazole phosphoribosyltransferase [Streptomyces sp. NBC_01185]|uniref:nicotinate-nucleotide--dimethylbenzimidazole phosphoribosyltransferase n=1 Tax=Streptomyces sp. NBC_01185 TaxID=2903764 RepID=UPI00386D0FB4|nr:nicotinate-nucleotide--dimethylbenzimidazole phosphoribosyltransferase [Streptomyces sp. NBC_01185]